MALAIILRPQAAPGNIDKIENVTAAGAQNVDTGTKATDRTNFLTAAGTAASSTGNLLSITYTDSNGTTQVRIINITEIQAVA